jgi:hypothetical protein
MPAPRKHNVQTPGAAPAQVTQADIKAIETGPSIEIGGRQVPLVEIEQSAFETSGMTSEEWDALDGRDRDERIGKARKEIEASLREFGERHAGADQQAMQARAAANVAARRAARGLSGKGAGASRSNPFEHLPHSSDIDAKELSAPMQCRDGILVPDTSGQVLKTKFK